MKNLKSDFIKYDLFNNDSNLKNWIVCENQFTIDNQAKFETVLSIGNGYASSRASHEGRIGNKKPGTFIVGTFNAVDGPEVPELPNCADLFDFDLWIDGEYVDSSNLKNTNYSRYLNIKNGLLTKKFSYTNNQKTFDIKVERFISLSNLHLFGQKLTINANSDSTLKFNAGINGQTTNSGANHFCDTYSEYINDVLNYVFTTTNTNIDFIYHKKINIYKNGSLISIPSRLSSVYGYSRRKLIQMFNIDLNKGDIL